MGKSSSFKTSRGNDYKVEGGVYTGYTATNKETGEKIGAFENSEDARSFIEQKEMIDNYAKENY